MEKMVVDLSAFYEESERQNIRQPLCRAIQRYRTAASILRDLLNVRSAIEKLIAIFDTMQGDERSTIGEALLTHSVVTYARATNTTGKARWKVEFDRHFNDAQKAKHKAIMQLRDNTFAHHSNGMGQFGEGWVTEKVLLEPRQDGARVYAFRHNFAYRSDIIDSLMELLEVAIPHVNQLARERAGELQSLLDAALKSDHELELLFNNHLLDVTTLPLGISVSERIPPDGGAMAWSAHTKDGVTQLD
jgi:hypothetical protein